MRFFSSTDKTFFSFLFTFPLPRQSLLFCFSSRRRDTMLQGDWSSDVCSSDLARAGTERCAQAPRGSDPATRSVARAARAAGKGAHPERSRTRTRTAVAGGPRASARRSEERRVGKRGGLGGRRVEETKSKEDEA